MNAGTNWRQRSIEELENYNYGNPDDGPTNMVRRCLELYKLPLEKFTVEDLRLMIGQQFALKYLIPLAIEQLKKDIFIEGDMFRGDLLENTLRVDTAFWDDHKYLWEELNDQIGNHRQEIEEEIKVSPNFDACKHNLSRNIF